MGDPEYCKCCNGYGQISNPAEGGELIICPECQGSGLVNEQSK